MPRFAYNVGIDVDLVGVAFGYIWTWFIRAIVARASSVVVVVAAVFTAAIVAIGGTHDAPNGVDDAYDNAYSHHASCCSTHDATCCCCCC